MTTFTLLRAYSGMDSSHQYGQIQNIGWESKLNRETQFILDKLKQHPHDDFVPSQIIGQVPKKLSYKQEQ